MATFVGYQYPTEDQERTKKILHRAREMINPISQLMFIDENLFGFLEHEIPLFSISQRCKDELLSRIQGMKEIWPKIIETAEKCPIIAAYHLGNTNFPFLEKKTRRSESIHAFYQGRKQGLALYNILQEVNAYLLSPLIADKETARMIKARVEILWLYLFADLRIGVSSLIHVSRKLRQELNIDF
jgi:hypothetical protein